MSLCRLCNCAKVNSVTDPCESGPPWQLVDHRLFELSKVTASGLFSALKYPPEDSIATLAAGVPLAESLVPVNSEMLSEPRLGTHSPTELAGLGACQRSTGQHVRLRERR